LRKVDRYPGRRADAAAPLAEQKQPETFCCTRSIRRPKDRSGGSMVKNADTIGLLNTYQELRFTF
jgi:hypothetical protein